MQRPRSGERYPQDRYPDNRGGSGRYDDRGLRDSVHRLDRLAKDFERDMDRALDRSRANGSDREDRINDQIHQFRDAVGDLKSRVGNGRDLNRSADEARRVLSEAQQLDRVARRFDGRTSSQWSQIQQELRLHQQRLRFRIQRWLLAAMTTGVVTTATSQRSQRSTTTIGGDEFHSLGN